MPKHRSLPTITTHPIDIFSRAAVTICGLALLSACVYFGSYLMGWL